MGDPGLPLAAAATVVCRWYAARNLPAMIAVPYPLGRPGDNRTDRFLGERGWSIRPGPAVVMTAPAAPFQAFASIKRNASTVAIGRVAVADGWGGLTAVEVHPDHRRTGLGPRSRGRSARRTQTC